MRWFYVAHKVVESDVHAHTTHTHAAIQLVCEHSRETVYSCAANICGLGQRATAYICNEYVHRNENGCCNEERKPTTLLDVANASLEGDDDEDRIAQSYGLHVGMK